MDNVLQIILPTDIGNAALDFLYPYARAGKKLKSVYLVSSYNYKTGEEDIEKGVLLQIEFEGIDDEA